MRSYRRTETTSGAGGVNTTSVELVAKPFWNLVIGSEVGSNIENCDPTNCFRKQGLSPATIPKYDYDESPKSLRTLTRDVDIEPMLNHNLL